MRGFIFIPNNCTNTATVKPAAILPAIMEIINEGIVGKLNFLTANDAVSPYVPSSKAIITAMGNITGMPVNIPLKTGVTTPKSNASFGDNKKPPINTGICMGKAIGPVKLNI